VPKDRFHEYLDYCDNVEIVGVGDWIEKYARGETLAWTFLMRDLLDTYKAGKLKRVTTENGSAAYVRPTCAKLPLSARQRIQKEGIPV